MQKQQGLQDRVWRVWAGLGFFFVFGLLWACGPSGEKACQQDSDCKVGFLCKENKCVAKSAEPKGETSSEGRDVDGGERSPEDDIGEPPPLPEGPWPEGKFPGPETLGESSKVDPKAAGLRKEGETCHASLVATKQDRCEKGLLCVAPDLGINGVCRQVCQGESDTSCGAKKVCGPVYSPDSRASLGFACGEEVAEGGICSFGRYCKKGLTCAAYFSAFQGMCLRGCEKVEDCGGDWCGAVRGFPKGDNVRVCQRFIKVDGESCEGPVICGDGLTCAGSRGARICRASCKNGGCAEGHVCYGYKDSIGQIVYSACLPVVKEFEPCNSKIRCAEGLLCVGFSSPVSHALCLKECTQDAKSCGAGSVCEAFSSKRKFCYLAKKEGELCDGPASCAEGLMCAAFRSGSPRLCRKKCDADPKVCESGGVCETVTLPTKETAALCFASCDQNDPKSCKGAGLRCVEVNGKGQCRTDWKSWGGARKRGESCLAHPQAPSVQQCGWDLRCLSSATGRVCMQVCDPKQPQCVSGESCSKDDVLDRFLCGKVVGAGEACQPRAGVLCDAKSHCVRDGYSSKGRCVTNSTLGLGRFCEPSFLPCESKLVCAGDPNVPYRWLCRTPCEPGGAGNCGANEVCLKTFVNGACFPACSDVGKVCTNPVLQCQELQSQKACL